MGEASPEIFDYVVKNSPLNAKYMNQIDRESAYEMLAARHPEPGTPGAASAPAPSAANRGNQEDPKPEPGLAEKILGTRSPSRCCARGRLPRPVRSSGRSSRRPRSANTSKKR
jgi:hypothetical protein